MSDVKWIKITTDMFDNRKVKHLRKLPEGNSIVLIWVMLLTMAGRCNAGGMIFLTENIPYTPKMLADELEFEENTVVLALEALEQLGMIVPRDGFFAIAGWEKHQSTERLSEIREYNRIAKQKSRERQKLLQDVNDKSMTSQRGHETEEEKEEEKELDQKKIYSTDAAVNQAMLEFLAFRKSVNASMTDHAVKLLIDKLGKLSNNPAEQVEILNQSMLNGWKSVYPLERKTAQKRGGDYAPGAYEREAVARRLAREQPERR